MFSVSGGVEINPQSLAGGENLKAATGDSLATARRNAAADKNTSWWWD